MGYACPVCDAPQADGEHLANHLALTALLHGDDHAAWLDERVPDWTGRDPTGLAAAVVDHAEPTDHETVFEDTTGERPDVDAVRAPAPTRENVRGANPETRRIVEEALELTRERREADRSEE